MPCCRRQGHLAGKATGAVAFELLLKAVQAVKFQQETSRRPIYKPLQPSGSTAAQALTAPTALTRLRTQCSASPDSTDGTDPIAHTMLRKPSTT